VVINNDSQADGRPFTADASVERCYQCGKCTAGCPLAETMERMPHQLIRLVQLGHVDRAAGDPSIWRCVSCLTCSARCPQKVDCAEILDALRRHAAARELVPAARRNVLRFHQAFLNNIRRHGRLNELELVGVFKTGAFLHDRDLTALLKDSLLAPKLMKRGKFHFRGQRVKDRGVVQRIFQRCMEEE
jgi:heterodisulfide reductase subunit C